MSDDGTDVVFFKFVADRAGDLSSGTLYAAKVTQLTEPGSAAADTPFQISWIELAHGTDAEIAAWVAEYDGLSQDDYAEGATSYISDEEVAAWARGEAADNRVAFLETRKAAAAKGATAEFRKMEGVNINLAGAADGSVPFMYMAMSEVSKGMSDDAGDIRVEANKCGVVYQMKLDANYNTHMMVPAVAGGPYDENNEANACAIDNISNPDNIVVLDNGDVLIGEDTGKHENNAMWLWRASAM
jgi:secreted PhoX family phosphatase